MIRSRLHAADFFHLVPFKSLKNSINKDLVLFLLFKSSKYDVNKDIKRFCAFKSLMGVQNKDLRPIIEDLLKHIVNNSSIKSQYISNLSIVSVIFAVHYSCNFNLIFSA